MLMLPKTISFSGSKDIKTISMLSEKDFFPLIPKYCLWRMINAEQGDTLYEDRWISNRLKTQRNFSSDGSQPIRGCHKRELNISEEKKCFRIIYASVFVKYPCMVTSIFIKDEKLQMNRLTDRPKSRRFCCKDIAMEGVNDRNSRLTEAINHFKLVIPAERMYRCLMSFL